MPAQTWYEGETTFGVGVAWRLLQSNDPGTEAYQIGYEGWIGGTGSTNRSKWARGIERASSTFDSTAYPNGTPDTSLLDCMVVNLQNGRYDAGTWTFYLCVRANTNTGCSGKVHIRLFRSANQNGSGWTEIGGGDLAGSTVTNLLNTATQDSVVSVSLGQITLTNEYLFVQVAWERTGGGGMTSSDVDIRLGNASGHGTRLVTPNFTANQPPTTVLNTTNGASFNTATPTLEMTATDPDGDSCLYQIEIATDTGFSNVVLSKLSNVNPGFLNTVTPADTSPFNSGEKVSFTVQGADQLSNGTYYWHARAMDAPVGSNTWGSYAAYRSFSVSAQDIRETDADTTGTSATDYADAKIDSRAVSAAGTSTAQADGVDAGAPVIEERDVVATGTSATNVTSVRVLATTLTVPCAVTTTIVGRAIWDVGASAQGTTPAVTGAGAKVIPSAHSLNNTSTTTFNTAWFFAVSHTLANTSTTTVNVAWRVPTSYTLVNTSTTTYASGATDKVDANTTGTSTTSIASGVILARSVALNNTSTANGVSGATDNVNANTAGTSTATGDGENAVSPIKEVNANTAGTSVVTGNGLTRARIEVTASSIGTSTAAGNSGATKGSAASTVATSVTTIAGAAIWRVSVSSVGTTATNGVSGARVGTVASAQGTSATDVDITDAATGSDGAAVGTSVVTGVSGKIAAVVATVVCSATTDIDGVRISSASASATGTSTASANSARRIITAFAITCTGTASAAGYIVTIVATEADTSGLSVVSGIAIIEHHGYLDVQLEPLQTVIAGSVLISGGLNVELGPLTRVIRIMAQVCAYRKVTSWIRVSEAGSKLSVTKAGSTLRVVPRDTTVEEPNASYDNDQAA